MKVLFLSTWYPYPADNGSKVRVYHLLRALAQKHDVTLLSFAFGTARLGHTGELNRLCREVHAVALSPFEVNRASTLRTFLSPRPLAARPISAMRDMVARHTRVDAFDAVIASTGTMAEYALMLPQSTTRILEEHNSSTRWMRERYEEQATPLQRFRCWASWQKTRRYEARVLSRFDLVTMVSELDRQACCSQLPGFRGRVELISNGVDCRHNRPGLAVTRPDSLVFNGSLTYSANYDAMRWFLAESYPLIRAQVPEVSLTITGSTKNVDLGGLRLDDSVGLTGYVDDVRVPVSEATVCAVPIRQGGGTRIKILEAMALGTPVVATSKGIEGHDGVVQGEHALIADEPAEFAQRVLEVLQSPERRVRLSQNARRLVEERYDWVRIGAQFRELCEAAIEARHQT